MLQFALWNGARCRCKQSRHEVAHGEQNLHCFCSAGCCECLRICLPRKVRRSYTTPLCGIQSLEYSAALSSQRMPGYYFFFLRIMERGFSSMPPFTRSLTNCFCLQGSMAGLWCSNPFLLTKETDGRSRERGRWAATGCCEPDVSLPLSSALVQSALAAQAVVEHLWNHGVCTIVLTVNDFL